MGIAWFAAICCKLAGLGPLAPMSLLGLILCWQHCHLSFVLLSASPWGFWQSFCHFQTYRNLMTPGRANATHLPSSSLLFPQQPGQIHLCSSYWPMAFSVPQTMPAASVSISIRRFCKEKLKFSIRSSLSVFSWLVISCQRSKLHAALLTRLRASKMLFWSASAAGKSCSTGTGVSDIATSHK